MKPDEAARLPEPDWSPPPLPPGFPRWKHFAWDGWDLEIPVDWDLGALELSPKGGYIRLDDEFEPRLMVKWQPLSGRFDPEKAIDRYFKKQPRTGELRPRIGASVPGISRAFKGLDYQTYTLASLAARTRISWGVSGYCPKCQRAFVIEMGTDSRAGDSERLVSRVLGSLVHHSEEPLTRWEAYGVSLDLPGELRAAGSRFQQGFVSLTAAARGQRVELCRWTLANVHLAAGDLHKFLLNHLARSRNSPRLKIEPAAVMSHPGCVFHTPRRLLEPVRARVRRTLALYNPAHTTGLIWHCAGSNRIFMLSLGSNHDNDIGAARLLASRVRCCKVVY